MALPFGAHVQNPNLTPSPLSFGFGLGVPQHHLPPPTPTQLDSSFSSASTLQRPQFPPRTSTKRRNEFDDNEGDAAMDTARSPSPADRPKRSLGGKRIRMIQQDTQKSSNGEMKPQEEEDSVDVGSMLASLPPASLLSLFTSVLSEKPELKPLILNLLPRPTLETALQALNTGARKLKEAYPYSQPSFSSPSLGFGFGSVAAGTSQPGQSGSMRESYVRTRLRQPVRDFTKLALSYVSYFSSNPQSNNSGTTSSQRPPAVPLHPSETFTFLHCLTLHLLRLPPLTLAEFVRPSENILFPRLQQEWSAWIQKVDDDVNRWGGMYRDEVVRGWERGLEELLAAEDSSVQQQTDGVLSSNEYLGVRTIKDRWVQRVGWLIGKRMTGSAMDEGL